MQQSFVANHRYYAIVIGLVCLSLAQAHAGVPTGSLPLASSYRTTLFNIYRGLPQNSVKDIVQTPDGFLWVATQEGLARFDGSHFAVYNTRNTPGLVSSN